MEQVGLSITEHSQPKYVKPKMRGQTLRSGVYWQAVLKQKGIKQVGRKIRATCAAENELQMGEGGAGKFWLRHL